MMRRIGLIFVALCFAAWAWADDLADQVAGELLVRLPKVEIGSVDGDQLSVTLNGVIIEMDLGTLRKQCSAEPDVCHWAVQRFVTDVSPSQVFSGVYLLLKPRATLAELRDRIVQLDPDIELDKLAAAMPVCHPMGDTLCWMYVEGVENGSRYLTQADASERYPAGQLHALALANIEKRLGQTGLRPEPGMPGLWRLDTNDEYQTGLLASPAFLKRIAQTVPQFAVLPAARGRVFIVDVNQLAAEVQARILAGELYRQTPYPVFAGLMNCDQTACTPEKGE